jgi:hypothetical protein
MKILVELITMIPEQKLEGWDNNPVKIRNAKYPQTKDDNLRTPPKTFSWSFVVHVVLVKHNSQISYCDYS